MNSASKMKWVLMSASLLLTFAGAATSFAADQRGERERADQRVDRGRHEVFDDRYHHGRYYPPRGDVVRVLPPGYRAFYHEGHPFFFEGGVWYAPGPAGFVVTVPPAGLVVSVLPPFATTVWLGGRPYYYADDVYYQWEPGLNSYEVVTPPAGADQPGAAPPGAPAPPPGDDFFVYPKSGQSEEQQSQDRYECHAWAAGQTGFDPTKPGGGVSPDQNAGKHDQYRRAMTACLDARGYSVQ
jgi:hypothetical protein